MKAEILKYYESLNIPIGKMINIGVGRKNLSADSIKAAAIEVYDEIQSGKIAIPKIRTAWEIFARARTIKTDVERKENQIIEDLTKQVEEQQQIIKGMERQLAEYEESNARRANVIRELHTQIEYHELPWWKKMTREKKHE